MLHGETEKSRDYCEDCGRSLRVHGDCIYCTDFGGRVIQPPLPIVLTRKESLEAVGDMVPPPCHRTPLPTPLKGANSPELIVETA
jgi:hypothetical protein